MTSALRYDAPAYQSIDSSQPLQCYATNDLHQPLKINQRCIEVTPATQQNIIYKQVHTQAPAANAVRKDEIIQKWMDKCREQELNIYDIKLQLARLDIDKPSPQQVVKHIPDYKRIAQYENQLYDLTQRQQRNLDIKKQILQEIQRHREEYNHYYEKYNREFNVNPNEGMRQQLDDLYALRQKLQGQRDVRNGQITRLEQQIHARDDQIGKLLTYINHTKSNINSLGQDDVTQAKCIQMQNEIQKKQEELQQRKQELQQLKQQQNRF